MIFREPIRTGLMQAAYRTGRYAWYRIDATLQKYERGGQPHRCEEEVKGKGRGLLTDCRCLGCQETALFSYFLAVHHRFYGKAGTP